MRGANSAQRQIDKVGATPEELDRQLAHYLGMPYQRFLTRREKLRRQGEMLRGEETGLTEPEILKRKIRLILNT